MRAWRPVAAPARSDKGADLGLRTVFRHFDARHALYREISINVDEQFRRQRHLFTLNLMLSLEAWIHLRRAQGLGSSQSGELMRLGFRVLPGMAPQTV